MASLTYDEARNVALLGRLPPLLRVAFALLCALRLFPAYGRFHQRTGRGDPDALAGMLDALWADIASGEMGQGDVQTYSERCLALVPSEEDGWESETQPYAEDAAAAVAYAFRARLNSDPQEAAWAARRVYEALDHWVQRLLDITPTDPADELAIQSHPLVQSELERQNRDLSDLAALASTTEIDQGLSSLRRRSETEAKSFFGPGH